MGCTKNSKKAPCRLNSPWLFIVAGILACILVSLTTGAPVRAAEIKTERIEIPDYHVQPENGLDIVSFPGSEQLIAEEGRPLVPCLIRSIQFPRGQRVQNVILKERSGPVEASGLNLPIVLHQDNPPETIAMKSGWYPLETHHWQVEENADGSTVLILRVFPFYYQPETRSSVFYQNFVFTIESIFTEVELTHLSVDRERYAIGDEVQIEINVRNPAAAQDVYVLLIIRRVSSGEVIDTLPLGILDDLSGHASYGAAWDSSPAGADDYSLEATLTDAAGSVLGAAKTVLIIREASEISQHTLPAPSSETSAPTAKPTQPQDTTGEPEAKSDYSLTIILISICTAIIIVIAIIGGMIIKRRKAK